MAKADRPHRALSPNPFYALLLVASTVFTVTVFAYLIGPSIEQRALDRAQGKAGAGAEKPGPRSLALAAWLDRNGPRVLAIEIGVMVVSGLLAMATDRWFAGRAKGRGRGRGTGTGTGKEPSDGSVAKGGRG
jgi:hypothetical protein